MQTLCLAQHLPADRFSVVKERCVLVITWLHHHYSKHDVVPPVSGMQWQDYTTNPTQMMQLTEQYKIFYKEH